MNTIVATGANRSRSKNLLCCIASLLAFSLISSIIVNAQTQWQEIATAPPNITSLVYHSDRLFATGALRLYCSTDEGATWATADSGITADNLGRRMTQVLAATAGGSLLVSSSVDGGALYRSTDNGNSWVRTLTNAGVRRISATSTGIYGLTNTALFKSTDDGVQWTQTTATLPSTFSICANDSFVFSCSLNGVVRSSDAGATWQPTALNNDFIVSLLATGSELFAGSDFGGVYRTTNNGVNWTRGDRDSLFNITLFQTGTDLYDGADRGIFRSTDRGVHWTLFGLTGSISTVGSIAASGTHMFALTNSGTRFWVRSNPFATAVSPVDQQPVHMSLDQNYPNPFNPSTTIRYTLSVSSYVTLVITDLLGRPVATLVNEPKRAGTYDVPVTNSQLASGVYFYTLRAGEYLMTRKLVMLK